MFGFLWVDQAHHDRMRRLAERLAHEGFPIPFFGTPENHNTPRAAARPGGLPYARWTICVNAFLPAIPFIHSGFELGEKFPINTGLDFTAEDQKKLPSETLPLFSEYGYNWQSADQFTALVAKVIAIRRKYRTLVADTTPATFRMMEEHNGHVLSFARIPVKGSQARGRDREHGLPPSADDINAVGDAPEDADGPVVRKEIPPAGRLAEGAARTG